MTLLQEYIVQQPALWRALLDSREEITGAFARRFGDLRPDRVVLIGSGSSHYAAAAVSGHLPERRQHQHL